MSFENPFKTPRKPLKHDTGKFIRDVLGAKMASDFEEMVGKKSVELLEENPVHAPLEADTEEERELLAKLEREQKREQLVNWAAQIGHDQTWVDQIFTFNGDGSYETQGNLMINGKEVPQFPEGFGAVNGNLALMGCRLKHLKGLRLPREIKGSFLLFRNDLESLDGLPPPENIAESIFLDKSMEERFIDELATKGYRYIFS